MIKGNSRQPDGRPTRSILRMTLRVISLDAGFFSAPKSPAVAFIYEPVSPRQCARPAFRPDLIEDQRSKNTPDARRRALALRAPPKRRAFAEGQLMVGRPGIAGRARSVERRALSLRTSP